MWCHPELYVFVAKDTEKWQRGLSLTAASHSILQVRELESRLIAGAQNRQSLEGRIAQQAAALGEAERKLEDADRRVVEKQRGLALLRADFAAQRVEMEEVTRTNAKLAAR